MSKNKLYMKVTNDKYELPLAVADSIADLARMTGIKPESLYSIISRDRHGKKHSYSYREVYIDDVHGYAEPTGSDETD